jgi:Fe-S-cluster containining protein
MFAADVDGETVCFCFVASAASRGDKLRRSLVVPPAMNPQRVEPEIAASVTCASCAARCCRLEVMLIGEDDVPLELTAVDAWGGSVMARLEDGWCAAVDRNTMRCAIYERRPSVCRDFELGGSDCLEERSKSAPIVWYRAMANRT